MRSAGVVLAPLANFRLGADRGGASPRSAPEHAAVAAPQRDGARSGEPSIEACGTRPKPSLLVQPVWQIERLDRGAPAGNVSRGTFLRYWVRSARRKRHRSCCAHAQMASGNPMREIEGATSAHRHILPGCSPPAEPTGAL
jgi:hypothetical protein